MQVDLFTVAYQHWLQAGCLLFILACFFMALGAVILALLHGTPREIQLEIPDNVSRGILINGTKHRVLKIYETRDPGGVIYDLEEV